MARYRAIALALAALAALAALTAPVAYALEPQTNWQLQCMGCHLADGSGDPGRVPSLRETMVPFSSFAEGRRFMLRVPGVAQSALNDAEVAELLNWAIYNLSAIPPARGFQPFTTAEVASSRREPLATVKLERERLLKKLPESADHGPAK